MELLLPSPIQHPDGASPDCHANLQPRVMQDGGEDLGNCVIRLVAL
jgi:hypothetical protein